MEIQKSILGIAKNNNGFFKSEKQSYFLISKMESLCSCIGSFSSGYNSCHIFAERDSKGIVKLTKHRSLKNGCVNEVMFERRIEGKKTVQDVGYLKTFKRKLNILQKDLSKRLEAYKNGSYSLEEYNRKIDITNSMLEKKTKTITE